VLREDQSLTSRITYEPTIASEMAKNELALFAQDNWQIHPRLALNLGVRLDTDSLAAEIADVAPRIGFVCAPTDDNRTAIRGGFGLFFDKIPIDAALFPKFPAQTITRYASDGLVVINGPTAFPHVIATSHGRLHVPYSLGWGVQFDRELRPDFLLRLGYEQREVYRDLYVDPYEPPSSSAQLRLLNSGRQSYREFLALLRWRIGERTTLYASYTRSKAKGELNDYNQFFGNFPYPLIRPNQFGTMSIDAPDRGLFWGVIGLPHKLDFIPIRWALSRLRWPRHEVPISHRLHLPQTSHPVSRRPEHLERLELCKSSRCAAVHFVTELWPLLQLHRPTVANRRGL
jgi:hypothetical protein